MSVEEQDKQFVKANRVTEPRPGHADLAGSQKYGFDDVRNVLERASARETTGRVAAGAIFKQLLKQFNIEVASHTVRIGDVSLPDDLQYEFQQIKETYIKNPEIRCVDKTTAQKMAEHIQQTRKEQDTLGGIVEVWAINVPPGLGSHVHYDRKIDGQLAQALMSVQSVKAVEIGMICNNIAAYGSQFHDQIYYSKQQGYFRKTNKAGGIEGGITNGMPVICRVYHKPISTIYKPLNSVDIDTKQPVKATVERSDICIVPRGGVVSEAMMTYVLAKNLLEKFSNDNLEDIKNAYQAYLERIK